MIRDNGFHYDEVTYTLKLFSFLLSHRTPSENVRASHFAFPFPFCWLTGRSPSSVLPSSRARSQAVPVHEEEDPAQAMHVAPVAVC